MNEERITESPSWSDPRASPVDVRRNRTVLVPRADKTQLSHQRRIRCTDLAGEASDPPPVPSEVARLLRYVYSDSNVHPSATGPYLMGLRITIKDVSLRVPASSVQNCIADIEENPASERTRK